MKKLVLIYISCLGFSLLIQAQPSQAIYYKAFDELSAMLEGKQPLNFKKAVFLTENAYVGDSLNYNDFCNVIDRYSAIAQQITDAKLITYDLPDAKSVQTHAALFALMKSEVPFLLSENDTIYSIPFQYDFEDFSGEKAWESMFVTKMLATHKGNCHSMPMFYKILAEELGEKAWLALSPNHMYIKLHNQKNGWYNTELTSGYFPEDSWLMASGYIHLNAIQNGIFMDTLSNQQSIALCMVDLAKGYERKFNTSNKDFELQCCEKALEHYPHYINALLLKANIYAQRYKTAKAQAQNSPETKQLEQNINALYTHIHTIGYRKMPKAMYINWMLSLQTEKEKYQNNTIITPKTN